MTVDDCFCSISLAVMTVSELVTWLAGISRRLVVTTTSGKATKPWELRVLAEASTVRVLPEGSTVAEEEGGTTKGSAARGLKTPKQKTKNSATNRNCKKRILRIAHSPRPKA